MFKRLIQVIGVKHDSEQSVRDIQNLIKNQKVRAYQMGLKKNNLLLFENLLEFKWLKSYVGMTV